MTKHQLVCQVYFWCVKFLVLVGYWPNRLLPDLSRYTMKQLFHIRGCICDKIIKIERNGI